MMAIKLSRAEAILKKASRHGRRRPCPYRRGGQEARLWMTRVKFHMYSTKQVLEAFTSRGLIDED